MNTFFDAVSSASRVAGVTAIMIQCTPEIAKLLLELNTSNRKIRLSVVEKYMREMENGEWVSSAQGVGIDSKNVLIDGQHRLMAIVRTGITCPLLVVFGLPTMAQEKTDRHAKRSMFDVMHLCGVGKSRQQVCAAAFLCRSKKATNFSAPADSDVKASLQAHEEGLSFADSIYKRRGGRSFPTGIMAAFCIGYEICGEKMMVFAEQYVTGTQLSHDDPAYRLLRWSSDASFSSAGGTMRQFEAYRKTCYAINAFFAGDKINQLREATEIVAPTSLKEPPCRK